MSSLLNKSPVNNADQMRSLQLQNKFLIRLLGLFPFTTSFHHRYFYNRERFMLLLTSGDNSYKR
ncbi:hypothetical protein EZS27_004116 [termite gut metagenome]|uniref:Uncharacterized protein n=1 Tax=termite gut metagenome TaxID=433724 RepID=A0A5J4SQI7_9ZZZZ